MTKPSPRISTGALLLLLIFVSLLSGCQSWSERGAKGLGTLPPASPNENKFSPYQPVHPYQQLTKGLLGRTLHASREAGTPVEVKDFLVGPKQTTDRYSLAAASVFEVKSGTGALRLGDKTQPIAAGTVVSIPASQAFTIENQSEIAIAIRVTILGGQ